MSDPDIYTEQDFLGLGATICGFVPGQRLLDRYVLRMVLDWSDRGVAWLADDEHLKRDVEIRFLPEIVRADPASLAKITKCVRLGMQLSHPHIARIYDFLDDSTFAAFSMEYVDGDTLVAWRECQPTGVFEVAHIHEWTMQLLDALDYAHVEAKLTHGDLNPSNLFGDEGDKLKIINFGVNRALSDLLLGVGERGLARESLVYMSPQMAMGGSPSAQDDIYAFGATIYALLTSQPPFIDDRGDLMERVQSEVPPYMAQRLHDLGIKAEPIPDEWELTIAACLLKDPAMRPESIAVVAERLGYKIAPVHVVTDEKPAAATEPPAIPPVTAPAPAKKPWRRHATPAKQETKNLWLILCLVILFVLDGLGFYFFKFGPDAEKIRLTELTLQANAVKETVAMSDAEKAVLIKVKQEDDARATAAELAAQQAKAETEKTKQSALQMIATALSPVVGHPWINSLGVRFVPAGTDGVLFSVWDVRVKDYAAFVSATGHDWPKVDFAQTENDPAVMVSWEDAHAFCNWLTKKEQGEGRLSSTQAYRLPSDLEWSKAVQLVEPDESFAGDRNGDVKNVFPWGEQWPPPVGAGNYAEDLSADGFAQTSPVGSFAANPFGLYDMSGNVWQWCEDRFDFGHKWRVLRGGSWVEHDNQALFSSCRSAAEPGARDGSSGFRVVLVVSP